jgi:hypothetical protein
MNYIVSFILSIVLTSLSYLIGSQFIVDGLPIWHAAVIGISVVSLGALTEKLGAPIWLIVLVPFPVGMILLYIFLNTTLSEWFLTYTITLALYTVIHVIMSYFFRFHSLIPAWKLKI